MFVKMMTSSWPRYYCILLLIATLEGSASPNDVGQLTIVSTQEKSNLSKDTLSIVMNSTAFLDAVGSRIEEILKNRPARDGITNCDCERRCKRKRFMIMRNIRLSWHDALIYCKEKRMNLPTIRNVEDHNTMLEDIKSSGMTSGAFWIGGTILHSTRGWFWISDGEQVTYTNWLSGQPDDFNKVQKCMTYQNGWMNDIRWAWDDNSCFSEEMFACEYCP